jgi:hypothetical protein
MAASAGRPRAGSPSLLPGLGRKIFAVKRDHGAVSAAWPSSSFDWIVGPRPTKFPRLCSYGLYRRCLCSCPTPVTSSRSPIRQFHARRGVACLAAHAVAADQAARGHAARAAARPLGPSLSRSNLRCLSGPPCRCSARGRTGQLPREPSSRSRSRRTGTRERHGVTPAFALISRPGTPLFLGFRCELAAPLQRDRPARIAWLQTARTGGVHARIHRVAGFASSSGPPATRAQPRALN